MAQPIQSQPEPEYGAGVAQQAADDQLAMAQAVGQSQQPQVEQPQQPQQEAPVMTAEGDEPEQPQGYTVKNPFMLLPAQANFPGQRQKTPVEQNYDIGLLWQVLAGSSAADDTLKTIAKRLLGEG